MVLLVHCTTYLEWSTDLLSVATNRAISIKPKCLQNITSMSEKGERVREKRKKMERKKNSEGSFRHNISSFKEGSTKRKGMMNDRVVGCEYVRLSAIKVCAWACGTAKLLQQLKEPSKL